MSVFSRELKLMKSKPAYYIAVIAILSGMSYGLMFILHIPVIPAYSHLKLDFADLGVALAALMLGPMSAVIVAFVKCALYLPFDMENLGVGVLSNFICCVAFAVALSLLFNIKRSDKMLAIALVSAVAIEIAIALLSNYFIIGPLFIKVMGEGVKFLRTPAYLFGGVLPLNLIKFGIAALLAFGVFKGVQAAMPDKFGLKFVKKKPDGEKEQAAEAAAENDIKA